MICSETGYNSDWDDQDEEPQYSDAELEAHYLEQIAEEAATHPAADFTYELAQDTRPLILEDPLPWKRPTWAQSGYARIGNGIYVRVGRRA
jgi:hypothetical protein